MWVIGELRQVPAVLLPALEDRWKRREIARMVMESEGLSLDKAWSGLGYLLGGLCDQDPIGGGKPLHGVDTGYGPPGLLSPAEVEACAVALAGIDEGSLRGAYDPAAMTAAEVYPRIWDREDAREVNLSWLLDVFRSVRDFYQEAAQRRYGLLAFLS